MDNCCCGIFRGVPTDKSNYYKMTVVTSGEAGGKFLIGTTGHNLLLGVAL